MLGIAWMGQTQTHLVPIGSGHYLTAATAGAFTALQQAAKAAGFNLQPASSWRSFERQCVLWNRKWRGESPIHNANNEPLDTQHLSDEAKLWAILRWSALPGTSRHHWGTDIDIYDPDALPSEATLRLEPWEYTHGYFTALTAWLNQHAPDYGFFWPYQGQPQAMVAAEPWHLSFQAEAQTYQTQRCQATLAHALQASELAGLTTVLTALPAIFAQLQEEQL